MKKTCLLPSLLLILLASCQVYGLRVDGEEIVSSGKSDVVATVYEDQYKAQKKAGRSDAWAKAYASHRADGKSHAYAVRFATEVENGKSERWANSYAGNIEEGHGDYHARQIADVYTKIRELGMPREDAKKIARDIVFRRKDNIVIDYQDNDGNTALIKAIQQNNIDWVNNLLEAGATCSLRNNAGKTALMIAVKLGNKEAVEAILSTLDGIMSRNFRDWDGNTVLTLARQALKGKKERQNYTSIITLLRQKGVKEKGIRRVLQVVNL